jgi:hypothetical protein
VTAAAGPALAATTRISGTVVPGGVTIELERTGVIKSPYTTHLFLTVHR